VLRSLRFTIFLIFLALAFASLCAPPETEVKMPSQKEIELQMEKARKAVSESQEKLMSTEIKTDAVKMETINLESIASELKITQEQLQNKKSIQGANLPRIYVCISLGFSDEAIKRILNEAKIVGASVVIRGFYKDFNSTIKRVSKFSGDGGLAIDPTIFEKYNIETVPAFVLTSENLTATAHGSASIRYFLELVVRQGTPGEAELAERFLKEYQKGRL